MFEPMTKVDRILVFCLLLAGACGGGAASGGDVAGPPAASLCPPAATSEYRLRIEGTGFSSAEGRTVYAGTALGSEPTCRAVGRDVIAGGAFTVHLVNRNDGEVYPIIGFYIDVDGNGRCDAQVDTVWTVTGTLEGNSDEFTQPVTPELVGAPGSGTCDRGGEADLFAAEI